MKTKYIGYFIVSIIILLLVYYSLWVYLKVKLHPSLYGILNVIQPFLRPDSKLDKFFPDKYWALAIPSYGASLVYSFSFIFLGWIFIFSYKENNNNIANEDLTQKQNEIHQKNE